MATIHDFNAYRAVRNLRTVSCSSSQLAGEMRTFQGHLSQLRGSMRQMEHILRDAGGSLAAVRSKIDESLDDWQQMCAAVDSGDVARMRRTLRHLQK